jgi:hypothetical protein
MTMSAIFRTFLCWMLLLSVDRVSGQKIPQGVPVVPAVTEAAPQPGAGESYKMGLEYALSALFPEQLVPKPTDRKSPFVLRVAAVTPEGTGFRHELRVMALRPGNHDLAGFLQRPDGTVPSSLPKVPIQVASLLGGAEIQGLRTVEVSGWHRWFGSYWLGMLAIAGLWVLLFIPILFWKREKVIPLVAVPVPPPPTLAERMRPHLEKLSGETPDANSQAELERLVHAYWREKLDLAANHSDMNAALQSMKKDPQAAESLGLLEQWLHYPPHRRLQSSSQLLDAFGKYV